VNQQPIQVQLQEAGLAPETAGGQSRPPSGWPFWLGGGLLVAVAAYFLRHTITTMSEEIIIQVVAGLIVAAVVGAAGWAAGKAKGRRQMQQQIEAAPEVYVAHLDKLIDRANSEGLNNILVNAEAIVTTRNQLQSSLSSLRGLLNSEIDLLAHDLESIHRHRTSSVQELAQVWVRNDLQHAYERVQVLQRVWPSKKDQVKIELRKLLAELNISDAKPRD
jgi:hypothetical protein